MSDLSALDNGLRELARIIQQYPNADISVCYNSLPAESKEHLSRFAKLCNNTGKPCTRPRREDHRLRSILAIQEVALSMNVQSAIITWRSNINLLHGSSGGIVSANNDNLTSIYWRKVDRSEYNEIEVIRDRVDSLILYHMAVSSKHHTGRSWTNGGLQGFTSQILSLPERDHTFLEKEERIQEWVASGHSYWEWVEYLYNAETQEIRADSSHYREDRLGYIIVLPQSRGILESTYTSRELRKSQRKEAAMHLQLAGIYELARTSGALDVGQRIRDRSLQGQFPILCPEEMLTTQSPPAEYNIDTLTSNEAPYYQDIPDRDSVLAELAFAEGIVIESTFNKSSTLSFQRPYDSPIFMALQNGNTLEVLNLLGTRQASVHDVDPYGLGILFYAAYYCWKGSGSNIAMELCTQLVLFGANTNWEDDIHNCPVETMIDSALASAISTNAFFAPPTHCQRIAQLFNTSPGDLWAEYLHSRGFTPLHNVVLGIDTSQSLEDFLDLSARTGTLELMINQTDFHCRTPLIWAVEFGLVDAVQALLKYGANPRQGIQTERGELPLLHLSLAGPPSQFLNMNFRLIVSLLATANVDINLKDHEGWTPLHVAASWGHGDLWEFLCLPGLDWNALTNDGESVDDLSPDKMFSHHLTLL
ncbi:hypothetical protein TRV_07559 [Trichophyton verrucosum HKI 0517]|uniref:Uncharacterized protein n=1 Tax=Trichophyton verrucosum (strain HKI 0517) TaxID=663202 RepID=D4DK38_TRIVH|nr:uncharacterized protein TRV_07559 [Trichophyton verrucosum HKI 0517]EFE37786.1 hypothetical protein TRV_07559 [Trichophyton verrucosum HKI 0517]